MEKSDLRSVIKDIKLSLIVFICSGLTTYAQTGNTVVGNGANAGNGDNNTVYGENAGAALTTGSENVILGSQAASVNLSEADGGVYIGYRAGYQATDQPHVTIVGYEAGLVNQGNKPTFIGHRAGYSHTTGFGNTFVGNEAGKDHTTGNANVFVGDTAGWRSLTGFGNTFAGNNAGFGDFHGITGRVNSAAGYGALFDLSTGTLNTASGAYAGYDISEGIGNTLAGAYAGRNISYSDFNTLIGSFAGLELNRTNETDNANRNTFVGPVAGYWDREGEDNVIIGAFAGRSRYDVSSFDEASWNTVDGSLEEPTLTETSYSSSRALSKRTALGSQAVVAAKGAVAIGYYTLVTEANGVAIGNYAEVTHANAVAMGFEAASHGDNIFVLGNDNTVRVDPGADNVTSLGADTYPFKNVYISGASLVGNEGGTTTLNFMADAATSNNDQWRIQATDGGSFAWQSFATGAYVDTIAFANTGELSVSSDIYVNSDRSLKEDIQSIDSALALLEPLRGVRYFWKEALQRDKRLHYGFIAQEVEAVLPELVSTDSESGMKSVNYQGVIPILINAAKELQEKNAALREVAKRQTDLNVKHAKAIAELQNQLAMLDAAVGSENCQLNR